MRLPERPVQMFALRTQLDERALVRRNRNVREDFRTLFGEDITEIDAVAIMTDTDNDASAHWPTMVRSTLPQSDLEKFTDTLTGMNALDGFCQQGRNRNTVIFSISLMKAGRRYWLPPVMKARRMTGAPLQGRTGPVNACMNTGYARFVQGFNR